jgi:hypothetical protein
MSDIIRAYGMKMSQGGTCRKCGHPRDKGDHRNCDRWPSSHSMNSGFEYGANSRETTIAEFKKIAALISAGESDDTRVQFVIKIRQVPE